MSRQHGSLPWTEELLGFRVLSWTYMTADGSSPLQGAAAQPGSSASLWWP